MKNLKLCLLTEYFPPEPGAGSTRAFEHARVWKNNGVDVTILTCMPHYPTGIIPPKYKNKIINREKIEDIDVLRTLTFAAESRGFFRRSFAYFTFMLSSVVQGAYYLKKYDYIIATSPPFSVAVSGWLLSKIKRTPLIFEVRDMWPESLVQLGQIKNKYIINLLELVERRIYESSKYIVSVTDSYCGLIEQKGIKRSKIKVIKNGVDLEFFKPRGQNGELLAQLNIRGKRIISYFGNFGLSQPIDQILEVAKLFANSENYHFLLIGDGERSVQIFDLIEQNQLNNVTVLKTVSKKALLEYYSISALMLVPLKNINLFKNVIPSKIFEIMAMGLPILTNVDGETRRIISEAGSGVYVDFYDVDATKNAILNILNNNDKLRDYSINGRTYVEQHFDRVKLAKKYIELLQSN